MSKFADSLRNFADHEQFPTFEVVAEYMRKAADQIDAYERAWTATSAEAQLMEENRQLQSKLDSYRNAIRAADRAIEACEGVSLVSYLNRGGAEKAVDTVLEALSDE